MTGLYLNQKQFEDIFKNHLKIETYSKPIESLYSIRNRGRIDYKPYYQRNYVWDVNKASYFIESLILGTEIPPLIFFNNGDSVEIIDGRQRFETIKMFMDNEIRLKRKGLSTLKHLENISFETLSDNIRDSFSDSTLRIIEFEIVNEPRLDPLLQDKVKKEIFGRYNSGITPLKRSEIDNAVYDEDNLSNIFKDNLKKDSNLNKWITEIFFKDTRLARPGGNGVPVESIMQFIRKNLVLHMVPITYYAAGRKNEIFERLYTQFTDSQPDHNFLFEEFSKKIELIVEIREKVSSATNPPNRLFYECILWIMHILENEGHELTKLKDEKFQHDLVEYASERHEDFSEVDYAFYAKVIGRYNSVLDYIQKNLNVDLHLYKNASSHSKTLMKDLMSDDGSDEKIVQLESLRLNKPEPSRTSIEDISRMMTRRKFLVRPSYQRSEVINLPKASAIIESILLGITLPAIFVYKRDNGVSEVIDGQQRILTILGYIGQEYLNEEGVSVKPKNSMFTLRNPKILTEYKGKKFDELPASAQEKILDFELFVVSIEQKLNPNFDPIDLFIRLNDKPYPIKEHSFEMWNSWADKDIITTIREDVDKNKGWFFVRTSDKKYFRDRMENEDIYLALTYLNYKNKYECSSRFLDIYQKEQRLNARICDKKDITHLLNRASSDPQIKLSLFEQVKETKSFIKKVKLLLISEDVTGNDVHQHLKLQLDKIFNSLERTNFRRTFQDFYILWTVLSPLTYEIIKKHRHHIRKDLENIMAFSKNIPEYLSNGEGFNKFKKDVDSLHDKYSISCRKITLTDDEIKQLIITQKNICPITGDPLYWGDEIEIDHIVPIALGGLDSRENLQAVHKDSNRKKGARELHKLTSL